MKGKLKTTCMCVLPSENKDYYCNYYYYHIIIITIITTKLFMYEFYYG